MKWHRPPVVVLGGLLVVSKGLIDKMTGRSEPSVVRPDDTLAVAARARDIVMETERGLGFEPTDRELDKLGYDIESRRTARNLRGTTEGFADLHRHALPSRYAAVVSL